MPNARPPRPTLHYRLVHVDNLATLLTRAALHARNSTPNDGLPYRTIHNPNVQVSRHAKSITCGPGGLAQGRFSRSAAVPVGFPEARIPESPHRSSPETKHPGRCVGGRAYVMGTTRKRGAACRACVQRFRTPRWLDLEARRAAPTKPRATPWVHCPPNQP